MTLVMIILGILAVFAIAATVVGLRSDGYRALPDADISRQAHPHRW